MSRAIKKISLEIAMNFSSTRYHTLETTWTKRYMILHRSPIHLDISPALPFTCTTLWLRCQKSHQEKQRAGDKEPLLPHHYSFEYTVTLCVVNIRIYNANSVFKKMLNADIIYGIPFVVIEVSGRFYAVVSNYIVYLSYCLLN